MGQINKPLMDLDQPSMQAEVNSYKPGRGFAWPQLFPLKYTSRFDLKGIDGDEGIPVSADRIAFNARSKAKTRKVTGNWNATLGKIAIKRTKDEIQINDYLDLKAVAARNTEDKAAANELVELVYNDITFCNNGMDARAEVEALAVGSMGKRTFKQKFDGDMVEAEEINFNVPTENFMGATVKWSDANADGLADIIKGQKLIAKKGGKKPMWAIMDQSAFDMLCVQPKVIKKIASAIVKATGLDSPDDVSLEAINRYMRSKGAPQILVIESYVIIEDGDGTQHTEQPWNPNSVVLSPEPRLGYTYYKTVPSVQNTEALQSYGQYYKMTRFASSLDPMEETTMAEAYIQPGLSNRRWLVYLNCMNTTWNEGEG